MPETSPSPTEQPYPARLAEAICRQGLRAPALILLESARPLAWMAAQAVWVAQPALSLFVPRRAVGEFARLLEEAEQFDALLAELAWRTSA